MSEAMAVEVRLLVTVDDAERLFRYAQPCYRPAPGAPAPARYAAAKAWLSAKAAGGLWNVDGVLQVADLDDRQEGA